jgi:hypothetical protein
MSPDGPGGSPFLPEEDSRPPEPSPWGFRIFVVLAAIYLLYRFGQGIGWLWQRL